MQSKLRLFYIQAKQAGNFFMGVAFNVMKEENHFFGGRQFHYRALQMHTLHVATNILGFSGDAAVQGQSTNRGEFADFSQERLVNLFRLRLRR